MFPWSVSTKADMKEAAKIRMRQRFEDERKERIFNGPRRLYGVDVDALNRQIRENRKTKDMEVKCEETYNELVDLQQQAVYAKTKELEVRQRLERAKLDEFRERNQRMEQRREFDLNDPMRLKKSQPARLADDDIRLGLSSAQIFEGEDLGSKHRSKLQKAQQRQWLDQQMKERKKAKDAERMADRVLEETLCSYDKRLEDLSVSERQYKARVYDQMLNYNTEMARRKKVEQERERIENYNDDLAEIFNVLTSDMMTESKDCAQSATNPHRKNALMYRGMSPEELINFREGQRKQLLEMQQRAAAAKLKEKQWEQHALMMDQELTAKDDEMEIKRKQILKDQIEFNKEMAKRQQNQREFERREASANVITNEFFENFNTTTR